MSWTPSSTSSLIHDEFVAHYMHDELIVDDLDALEHVLALRDDLAPARALRLPGVDGDHAFLRGIQVGEKVEHRSIVADEAVARVEIVDQPRHRARHLGARGAPQVETIHT